MSTYAHDAHCNTQHEAGPQPCPKEEYAVLFSGGSMLVRPDDPEVERIFPLADWIPASQRFGGKVYRRVITVVEDWEEVPRG